MSVLSIQGLLPSLTEDLLLSLSDRKSALEQALTEKQDLLARMADCLAWLNQAERHLANQRPLGTDYHRIHEQYEVQQVGRSNYREESISTVALS